MITPHEAAEQHRAAAAKLDEIRDYAETLIMVRGGRYWLVDLWPRVAVALAAVLRFNANMIEERPAGVLDCWLPEINLARAILELEPLS